MIIFHLYYSEHAQGGFYSHYLFSNTDAIVEFLNRRDNRYGIPLQTVLVCEVDNPNPVPYYLPDDPTPCSAFSIDRQGNMHPLNKIET